MAGQVRPHIFKSVWQQRQDAWTDLEAAASRVASLSAQARTADEPAGKVRDLLNLLDPVEHFWAFPGRPRFEQVRRLFSAFDFDRCARLVADINRAMADDTYRGRISWRPSDDNAEGSASGSARSAPSSTFIW